MGGAELLLLRRANLFKRMGMNIKIIVIYDDGEYILKDRFTYFDILKIDGLSKPFCCHSKHSLNKINEKATAFLCDFQDAIIESQTFHTAVWAEFLVSRHPSMKHIIYAVDDNNVNTYKCYPFSALSIYKKERGEFWGTEKEGLKKIFPFIHDNDDDFLPVSFDEEELKDNTVPALPYEMLQNEAIVVSTIGRLEKGCVSEIIDTCKLICKEYPSLRINVIVGGGSSIQGLEDEMKRKYSVCNEDVPNLKVFFMGYITYIGKDFYQNTDVYVGMATSSVNSISQQCATINYDPIAKASCGVFGLNTFNFLYIENDQRYDLKEQLEHLILDNDYRAKAALAGKKYFEKTYTIEASVRKQEFLLGKSTSEIIPFNLEPSFKVKILDMMRYYCWSLYNLKKILFHERVGMYMN